MVTLFLPGKRHSFYFRSIIPRRLQPLFNRRAQLWRSLKTTDRDEAKLRPLTWQTRAQRLFLILKRQGAHMAPAEIERLIARLMNAG